MRSSLSKHRDMARSILPSRARSTTRQLADAKRAARRRVNQQLARVRHLADTEEWDEDANLRAYPDIEIAQIVWARRGADKLNHFERWAVEVTKAIRHQDRLGYLRGRLPGGLIGAHAMSHLRRIPALNPWEDDRRAYSSYRERELALRREEAARLRRRLLVVLETPGAHKALNAAIKAASEGKDDATRTLAGGHDVDAFLADVLQQRYTFPDHPRWRRALEGFLASTCVSGPDERDSKR